MTTEEIKEILAETGRMMQASQARTDQRIQDLVASQDRTDQQIQDLVASQDRTDLRIQDLVASQDRTDQRIQDLVASQDRTHQQIQASQDRVDQQMQASQARADQQMQELRDQMKETDKAVKRTTQQLGELGNRLGGITEGLLLPSVRRILDEDLGMETVINASGHRNGDSFQFDAVGYTNGGKNAACVVEVKSHLREEGLQQLLGHLRTFGDFFPEHKDKKLYGMLAAIDVNEDIEKRVLRQGIYLVKVEGDLCRLCAPERPRVFN